MRLVQWKNRVVGDGHLDGKKFAGEVSVDVKAGEHLKIKMSGGGRYRFEKTEE